MSTAPGRREVAYRLFAAEFDDANLSYSESDEERAPNYVVTPTGARVNRLFLVGVLTELERVNDDMLRARIVDPTGAFVVYAGQYQPDELAFLERVEPPAFLAVTGKARTFQPEDSDRVYTSVRPESISEVDAETRDRWVVQAAEQTLERIAAVAGAKRSGLTGERLERALADHGVEDGFASGVARALDHYGATGAYLAALRETALDAARVVAGEREEARPLELAPGEGDDAGLDALADPDVAALGERAEAAPTAEPDAESAAETGPAADVESETDAGPETEAEPTVDAEPEAAEAPASSPDASTAGGDPDAGGDPVEDAVEAAGQEPAGEAETTAEPGATSDAETPAESDAATEPATGSEPATEAEPADESKSAGESPTPAESEGPGDFESGEFDLPEEEREQIEEEFGTEFETGNEVDEAGAADIEPETPAAESDDDPEPTEPSAGPADAESGDVDPGTAPSVASETDEEAAATSDVSAGETAEPETAEPAESDDDAVESDTEAAPEADAEAASEADAADVDLEDAVVDVMRELDDDGGATREHLVSTMAERYGADEDAVADAIESAMMSGQCYEPEDGVYKPI